jgi:hypothetical protein
MKTNEDIIQTIINKFFIRLDFRQPINSHTHDCYKMQLEKK